MKVREGYRKLRMTKWWGNDYFLVVCADVAHIDFGNEQSCDVNCSVRFLDKPLYHPHNILPAAIEIYKP